MSGAKHIISWRVSHILRIPMYSHTCNARQTLCEREGVGEILGHCICICICNFLFCLCTMQYTTGGQPDRLQKSGNQRVAITKSVGTLYLYLHLFPSIFVSLFEGIFVFAVHYWGSARPSVSQWEPVVCHYPVCWHTVFVLVFVFVVYLYLFLYLQYTNGGQPDRL